MFVFYYICENLERLLILITDLYYFCKIMFVPEKIDLYL